MSTIATLIGEFLERSPDPRIKQLGAAIKDLPAALVRKAADIFWGGKKADGTLSDKAIEELSKLQQTAATSAPVPTDFLDSLATDLNVILEASRLNGAIALKGFLHTSDCISYWKFPAQPEDHLAVETDLFDKSREIMFHPQIEVLLAPLMTDAELAAFNYAIALKDESKLKEHLSKANDRVLRITLSDVEVERTTEETVKRKRGNAKSERPSRADAEKVRKSVAKVGVPLDKTWNSLKTMLNSVPEAKKAQSADTDSYNKSKDSRG